MTITLIRFTNPETELGCDGLHLPGCKQALESLKDSRENVAECLIAALPHDGFPGLDGLVCLYQVQLKRHDKAIVELENAIKECQ